MYFNYQVHRKTENTVVHVWFRSERNKTKWWIKCDICCLDNEYYYIALFNGASTHFRSYDANVYRQWMPFPGKIVKQGNAVEYMPIICNCIIHY